MAAKAHVFIDGQPYVIADESYQSKIVPLFRPQLVVQGISREALDQYLYLAQDDWSKGSNALAEAGRWLNGGFGVIEALDNSEEGKVTLQRVVTLVEPVASNVRVRLASLGDYLYAFYENGDVKRSIDGTTWGAVTYDDATYGAITCAVVITTTSAAPTLVGGFGSTVPSGSVRFLLGTATGKAFAADGGATITPISSVSFGSTPIRAMVSYRDLVALGIANRLTFRTLDGAGTWGASAKYQINVPGAVVALTVWQQAVWAAIQTGDNASMLLAADANQAIDSYRIEGGFVIQSLTTWGGQLAYAGSSVRNGPEVYTYPQTLVERLPYKDALTIPFDVLALYPTSKYVLAGHNRRAGLWWAGEKGAGPIAEYTASSAEHSIIVSIAEFKGNFYYTLESDGILRVEEDAFITTTGRVTTGDFDGGFPELTKEVASIFIRLDEPLATGEVVTVVASVDGGGQETIGSMTVGERDHSFDTIPAAVQSGKRYEIVLVLNGPGDTRPTVTALVARYITIPIQKRVWGFTIKAAQNLQHLDGSRDTRSPAQIIAALYALRTAGQVTFTSALEPDTHTVYVTNVDMKAQLMGRSRPDQPEEAHLGVELLEV